MTFLGLSTETSTPQFFSSPEDTTQASVTFSDDIANSTVLFYYSLYRFDNSTSDCNSTADCTAFVNQVMDEQGPIQYNYEEVQCFPSSQAHWEINGCALVSFTYHVLEILTLGSLSPLEIHQPASMMIRN